MRSYTTIQIKSSKVRGMLVFDLSTFSHLKIINPMLSYKHGHGEVVEVFDANLRTLGETA